MEYTHISENNLNSKVTFDNLLDIAEFRRDIQIKDFKTGTLSAYTDTMNTKFDILRKLNYYMIRNTFGLQNILCLFKKKKKSP